MSLKLNSPSKKLRFENRLLSSALGKSLALLTELLHVEDWEEFQSKRDEIQDSMDEMQAMMGGKGARDDQSSARRG